MKDKNSIYVAHLIKEMQFRNYSARTIESYSCILSKVGNCFADAYNLIQYLSNYTHRVAISNQRLREHKDGKVSFCYKDYNAAGISKCITLDAVEFIRRFLQHVLPAGFYKIRYFGFMAMCNMQSKLALCFDLIEKAAFLPVLEGLTAMEVWRSITGLDPLCCPKCRIGKMKLQMPLVIHNPESG